MTVVVRPKRSECTQHVVDVSEVLTAMAECTTRGAHSILTSQADMMLHGAIIGDVRDLKAVHLVRKLDMMGGSLDTLLARSREASTAAMRRAAGARGDDTQSEIGARAKQHSFKETSQGIPRRRDGTLLEADKEIPTLKDRPNST